MRTYKFYIEYANGADKTERHEFHGIDKALQYAKTLIRETTEKITITLPSGKRLRIEDGKLFSGSVGVELSRIS